MNGHDKLEEAISIRQKTEQHIILRGRGVKHLPIEKIEHK